MYSLLVVLHHFKFTATLEKSKVASHEVLFSASVFFKNPKFEFDEVKC